MALTREPTAYELHYRLHQCARDSRVCRYCHPEGPLCEMDADIASGVREAPAPIRLSNLFRSEMRYRNKFSEKHLNDLRRAANGGRLRTMIQRRLEKRIRNVTENDGRQTPYLAHGIDVACHFCATCCRRCTGKWHATHKTDPLSNRDINKLVDFMLMFIMQCILLSPSIQQVMTEHPQRNLVSACYYQPALILVEPPPSSDNDNGISPWQLVEFIPDVESIVDVIHCPW